MLCKLTSTASNWWLRSTNNNANNFHNVNTDGSSNNNNAQNTNAVALGSSLARQSNSAGVKSVWKERRRA